MTQHDESALMYLRRAVELSEEGMAGGFGGPFGAVVVKDGRVIGEGFNRVLRDNDPTAHAEVVAIRNACRHANDFNLSGCEIYASAQPCPMCLAAIYWSRAAKVVYANTIADAAAIGFDDSRFYDELQLPPARRAVPQVHIDLPEAKRAFQQWAVKAGKTRY